MRVIAKKCSIAIVKVGASGSYIRKGTEEIKVSAIPVQKVVDTTGAGDYFASGFLYGLTCGYSLDKCAKTMSTYLFISKVKNSRSLATML